MTSYTTLTFTINAVYGVAINIDIEGETDESEVDVETVTIPAGSLTASSTKTFKSVSKIAKTKLCTPDISITDINDIVLGKIIGRLYASAYTKIQIDYNTSTSIRSANNRYLEVAFKHRFLNYFNYQDSFLGIEAENAVFWAYIAQETMTSDDRLSARASNKVKSLLKSLALKDVHKDHIVEYAEEPAFNILHES